MERPVVTQGGSGVRCSASVCVKLYDIAERAKVERQGERDAIVQFHIARGDVGAGVVGTRLG